MSCIVVECEDIVWSFALDVDYCFVKLVTFDFAGWLSWLVWIDELGWREDGAGATINVDWISTQKFMLCCVGSRWGCERCEAVIHIFKLCCYVNNIVVHCELFRECV